MKHLFALALAVFTLSLQATRAEHGPPVADSTDELVASFAGQVDDLAAEYFFEAGELPGFDEPRFNRLVGIARILVERARGSLDRGRLCQGALLLAHSVRHLDAATNFAQAAGMSGSGFSDDLAGLTAARLQFFLEDLIVLSAEEGLPERVLTIAGLLEEAGDQAVAPGEEGNWFPAVRYYAGGVCLIGRFL